MQLIASIFLFFLQIIGMGGPKSLPVPTPTPSPEITATPTPSDTPTPTPSPTLAPKPKVQSSTTNCSRFDGGKSTVTVTLQPNTGSMTGDTVIRIKPTGKCPGESQAIEHWLHGNELSWTSSEINSGRYRIEVANGYYQGVIAQEYDLYPGQNTLTIQVSNG